MSTSPLIHYIMAYTRLDRVGLIVEYISRDIMRGVPLNFSPYNVRYLDKIKLLDAGGAL